MPSISSAASLEGRFNSELSTDRISFDPVSDETLNKYEDSPTGSR